MAVAGRRRGIVAIPGCAGLRGCGRVTRAGHSFGGDDTSTSRPLTSSVPTTTRTTATTSSAPAAVTFDAMKNLVTGYADLPGNAAGRGTNSTSTISNAMGSDDYLGFWSTIDSVSVLSVGPRDATSVVATIRYVLRDGRVDTENRWLSVVPVNGQLLIYDSEHRAGVAEARGLTGPGGDGRRRTGRPEAGIAAVRARTHQRGGRVVVAGSEKCAVE